MRRQVLITLRLTLLRATRTNMAAEVGADAGAVAGCEAAAADHWGCMVGGGILGPSRLPSEDVLL